MSLSSLTAVSSLPSLRSCKCGNTENSNCECNVEEDDHDVIPINDEHPHGKFEGKCACENVEPGTLKATRYHSRIEWECPHTKGVLGPDGEKRTNESAVKDMTKQ